MKGLKQEAGSRYCGFISLLAVMFLAAAAFLACGPAWAQEEGGFDNRDYNQPLPDTYNPVDFTPAYTPENYGPVDYGTANSVPSNVSYDISGTVSPDYGTYTYNNNIPDSTQLNIPPTDYSVPVPEYNQQIADLPAADPAAFAQGDPNVPDASVSNAAAVNADITPALSAPAETSGGFWSSIGNALSSVGKLVYDPNGGSLLKNSWTGDITKGVYDPNGGSLLNNSWTGDITKGVYDPNGGSLVNNAATREVASYVYDPNGASLVNNAATRFVKDTVSDAFYTPDTENYPSAGKQILAAVSTVLAPLTPVVPFAADLKGAMELSKEQYNAYKQANGSVPYVLRPVGTEGTITHDVLGMSNTEFYPTPSYREQGFATEEARDNFIKDLNSERTQKVEFSFKNDAGAIDPQIIIYQNKE